MYFWLGNLKTMAWISINPFFVDVWTLNENKLWNKPNNFKATVFHCFFLIPILNQDQMDFSISAQKNLQICMD